MSTLAPYRPPLLLTRPRAGAERFAGAFRARFGADWPVVFAPLVEISATGEPVPQAEALVFTSEQAVGPVVAAQPAAGRVAYCVGERTAQTARKAGFEVIVGGGDAAALCALIVARHRGGRLLHARGNERAFPVAETLVCAGIDTVEAVVYQQKPCVLTAQGQAVLQGAEAVLVPLFSPNAGRLFAAAAKGARAPLWLAAISPAVRQTCAELTVDRAEIAPEPNASGMLVALERLLYPSVRVEPGEMDN